MDLAMNPTDSDEIMSVAEFVGEMLRMKYHDETIAAMLAPLKRGFRTDLIQARTLVSQGAQYYLAGDVANSIQTYDRALTYVKNRDSVFDELWVNLNRADTEIRLGHFQAAKASLDTLTVESEAKHMRRMLAMTLASYGSAAALNRSYPEMMSRLEEAVQLFHEIDAPAWSMRASYYLAVRKYTGGDLDEALKLATDCLSQTESTDHIRLVSLEYLVSVILYKRGLPRQATVAGKEALAEAQKTRNPSVVTTAASTLASLSELNNDSKQADQLLTQAEQALKGVILPIDQLRSTVTINALTARIQLSRNNLPEAERFLKRNLEAFESKEIAFTYLISETWMLLGRTYALTNRVADAHTAFQNAVEVAEADGQFLQSERFRQSYDDIRRELYDSAIAFSMRTTRPTPRGHTHRNTAPSCFWNFSRSSIRRSRRFIPLLSTAAGLRV